MSRFHSKNHFANHYTDPISGDPDSASDPIASEDNPFQGDFHIDGELIPSIPIKNWEVDNLIVNNIVPSLSVNSLTITSINGTIDADTLDGNDASAFVLVNDLGDPNSAAPLDGNGLLLQSDMPTNLNAQRLGGLGSADYLKTSQLSSTVAPLVPSTNPSGLEVPLDYMPPEVANDTIQYVNISSDLQSPLDSDKVYIVAGVVNMGSHSIVVPSGGLNIIGLGGTSSVLSSDEDNYTMFVDNANDAGTLTLTRVELHVTGTNSKVFDLNNNGNNGRCDFNLVNCRNCTEMGLLSSYAGFTNINSQWHNCKDGLKLAGYWDQGVFINTMIVRGFNPLSSAENSVFEGLSSFSVNGRFASNANIDLSLSSYGYNIEESMIIRDGGFTLLGGEYNGDGVVSPHISSGSNKANFRDNNGMLNTYVGARWNLSSEVATTISNTADYFKVAGGTTYFDEQWFTHTTDNAFVYNSSQRLPLEIKGTLSITSGNNQNISFRLRRWVDDTSSYEEIATMPSVTTDGGGVLRNIAVVGYLTVPVELNDRIELWVRNETSATNITLKLQSLLSVTSRP